MQTYLISLLAGILVGVIYHFMGVRSPAPPLIALLGLLGILIGENGMWKVKDRFFPKTTITSNIPQEKSDENIRR